MSPFLSSTTPEPSPSAVSISTTDGATRLTTAINWFCSAPAPAPGGDAAAATGASISAASSTANVFKIQPPEVDSYEAAGTRYAAGESWCARVQADSGAVAAADAGDRTGGAVAVTAAVVRRTTEPLSARLLMPDAGRSSRLTA